MRANGRARVSARSPNAFGVCDRDGFRYNLRDLVWQEEWSGLRLQNTRFLVCRRCLDVPNEQLRAYAVPPDPIPVRNPRPDSSFMGGSVTVTTIAGINATYLLDGLGNRVLDGFGNPIVVSGTFTPLLAPDPTRVEISFAIPLVYGLWVNLIDPAIPSSGAPYPDYPGSQFYARGTVFELNGLPAQNGVNCFTTVAGLQITVITS